VATAEASILFALKDLNFFFLVFFLAKKAAASAVSAVSAIVEVRWCG
jgi:hypothetical protein